MNGLSQEIPLYSVEKLKRILRRLNKSSNANKPVLVARLLESLAENYSKTQLAIQEVLGSNSTSTSSSHQTVRSPTYYDYGPGIVVNAPQQPRFSLDFHMLEREEILVNQGLVEKSRVIGYTWVDEVLPRKNLYSCTSLSSEEISKLNSKDCKIITRFVLFNPRERKFQFPQIWPSNCQLHIDGERVIDTVPKNRLQLNVVGQQIPLPAVDCSKLWTGNEYSTKRVTFEVNLNSSQMKWLVITSVLTKKPQQVLLQELLVRSPVKRECETRVINSQKPSSTDDGEVDVLSDATISLKDPSSLAKIKIAARGTACKHLQCFDLFTYLDMQQGSRTPKWRCPLCGASAKMKELLTDSWFQEIIKESDPNHCKAQIKPDASWSYIEEEEDDDDDYSDEEEEDILGRLLSTPTPPLVLNQIHDKRPMNTSQGAPRPKKGNTRAEAIEILDDDDLLF